MYRVITGSFSVRRVALVLVEHALIVLAVVVAAIVRLGFPDAYTDWVMRSVVVGGCAASLPALQRPVRHADAV